MIYVMNLVESTRSRLPNGILRKIIIQINLTGVVYLLR